jgi:hypothetical protein
MRLGQLKPSRELPEVSKDERHFPKNIRRLAEPLLTGRMLILIRERRTGVLRRLLHADTG